MAVRVIAALLLLALAVPARAQERGNPGQFDYYVLSLSWSPTWCATQSGRRDVEQCAGPRSYGFVVHGLWPQYAGGGYPVQCAAPAPLPPALVEAMLPLMPSRKLIAHQWKRHGTCAGTAPEAYFATTRRAFDRVRMPDAFARPAGPQTFTVQGIESLFAAANPGLEADAVSVVCRGRHGAEVRVCMDRELNFRACGRDVRDRCKGDVVFPAVR
jgi:Ribonuclease I